MTFYVKFVLIFSIIIYYLQTNKWKYVKRILLHARNWRSWQKQRLQLPGHISSSHCKTASGTCFHLVWKIHVSTVTAVGRSSKSPSTLELVSEIVDMVKICALRSSVQSLHLIVVIKSHDCSRNMTDDIVILIATWVQPVKLRQSRKRIFIQNWSVGSGVKSTWNINKGPRVIPGETFSQHNSTFVELLSWQNTFWQESFSRHTHNLGSVIRKIFSEPWVVTP